MQNKTVGAFEARRQFGDLIEAAGYKGQSTVVERNGKPLAAIVPLQVLQDWERRREQFFAQARATAEQSHLTDDEAMELALQAVAEVRVERGRRRS
jgi:prevent-host-death family protein